MITNFLTIDVEDFFQVSAFEKIAPTGKWNDYESRVMQNTDRILQILETAGIKATFFIIGWTADKHPRIVRDIAKAGHEIGCHSYWHRLVYNLTPEEFRADTKQARETLENISGRKVVGFRAPSYSITNKSLWALDILEELGFEFDSSIFPILHDRYGIPDAPRFRYKIPGHNLMEYPISTSKIFGRKIPVSGGGYFRLFPYWFTRMALKRINEKEKQPFIFYLHPWEIDPDQPRMQGASALSRFRHYNNLDRTKDRFTRLLADFQFGPIPNQE